MNIIFFLKKYFNLTSLKQLEHAALSVLEKKENSSMAEFFSIEIKFTVDCIKKWFRENRYVEDSTQEQRFQYKDDNLLNLNNLCCLCDMPLKAEAESGWLEHVIFAEYLFLSNIYSEKEMKKMGIENLEVYSNKIKILENLNSFCSSIKKEKELFPDEIDKIIFKMKKIKTENKDDEDKATREKTIGYLYLESINLLPTDKTNTPISQKILSNMISIFLKKITIHHSHTTGTIIGYAHDFCNQHCKENYFTIPVLAHNQF